MNGQAGARKADSIDARRPAQITGLLLGLVAFIVMLAVGAPAGMAESAWSMAALTVLMAIWWISEALPLAATALLPLALMPLLNIMPLKQAAASYAHPAVFLILGGFIIGAALQRWRLHRRLALTVLAQVGTRPAALIGGFMLATAGLSMWISNAATTIMMLPIALSVLSLTAGNGGNDSGQQPAGELAPALLLGVAYAASIGGVATLIGTAPNALMAAYAAETLGRPIGFAEWILVGLPITVILLGLAWLVLSRFAFRLCRRPVAGAAAVIAEERAKLGRLSKPERRVALVFTLVALAWISRPALANIWPNLPLSDAGIAMIGALALFLVPSGADGAERGTALLGNEWAGYIPWSVLILFGGGLSLAAGIGVSGLGDVIGAAMQSVGTWPIPVIIIAATAAALFATEIASNTATTVIFLPLATALAQAAGINPLAVIAPAVMAASCAFMLPVATPPNAVVFAGGHVKLHEMMRAGLWLNLAAAAAISLAGGWLTGTILTG